MPKVIKHAHIEAGVTVIRRYGIGGNNLQEVIQAILEAVEAIGDEEPSHPIAPGGVDPGFGQPTPPGQPTHPIAGPGEPTHPIAPGGEPPHPDQGLPTPPAHPDQGLPQPPPQVSHPIAPGGEHPDQGLPENPAAPSHPVAPPPSASHPIAPPPPPPAPEPRHKR